MAAETLAEQILRHRLAASNPQQQSDVDLVSQPQPAPPQVLSEVPHNAHLNLVPESKPVHPTGRLRMKSWQEIVSYLTPSWFKAPSFDAESWRENLVKRIVRFIKRALAVATIFFVIYLLYLIDIATIVAYGVSPSSASAREPPPLLKTTWYFTDKDIAPSTTTTNSIAKTKAPWRLKTPPWNSLEDLWNNTRVCKFHVLADDFVELTSELGEQLFYYAQKDATFMSLDWIQEKMMWSAVATKYESDFLCTFMFGGWPLKEDTMPCLCFPDGGGSLIISPVIHTKSDSVVQVKVVDDFIKRVPSPLQIEGAEILYPVHKMLTMSWHTLARGSREKILVTGQPQTVVDTKNMAHREFSRLDTKSMKHLDKLSLDVEENYRFQEMVRLLHLASNRTNNIIS